MGFLKKVFVLAVLMMVFTLSVCVFANGQKLDTVSICLSSQFIPSASEGDVVFGLYDEAGKTLLSTQSFYKERSVCYNRIEFSVPEYSIGTKFTLRLESGAEGLVFCEKSAKEHVVETYAYPDENGTVCNQTEFYMELLPLWSKNALIKIPGVENTNFAHFLIGDEVYVTTDLLDAVGIDYTTDFDTQKPFFTLTDSDKEYIARFYVDDIYATFGGAGENLAHEAFAKDGLPYVPLSRVADYFECNYSVESDDQYQKVISLTLSKYSEEYESGAYVNSLDISSRTPYLVWVSKKDYTVNVYLGANGSWRLVKSARCAIGAPQTPTVEGVFVYHQYQSRWQYDGYYCGPVMRFYRGYALHSTLIRNSGTFYDNRVGMKISQGCVRLRPEDIQWLVDYVQLGSTVLVTK